MKQLNPRSPRSVILVACALLAVSFWSAELRGLGPDTTPAKVTFNRDIAPIVYQYCAACHRPGEAGPFRLLTYQDVKSHGRQIMAVTHTRFMPPWPPEPGELKPVSYTHLRAHETDSYLVCRLLL